ncbi:MAG: hypothetical protein ACK55Z_33385, partial [bacterium]
MPDAWARRPHAAGPKNAPVRKGGMRRWTHLMRCVELTRGHRKRRHARSRGHVPALRFLPQRCITGGDHVQEFRCLPKQRQGDDARLRAGALLL